MARSKKIRATRLRIGSIGAVLALVCGLTVSASAEATPSPAPLRVVDGPAIPAAPTAAVTPASAVITMITGDRILLDTMPDGRQTTTVLATSSANSLVQFVWEGDHYTIPAGAVPYLNSTLDPRLFDVSYLARAHLDDAHSATLPVTITHQTATAKLTGVRIAQDSAGSARADVTKAQALALGRQLLSGRGNGISRITLAPGNGTPPLPAALPMATRSAPAGLHYRTLTLNFTDRNGAPATGVGWVQNIDDARLGRFVVDAPGPTSISVPDGTYSIEMSVLMPHASDPTVDAALIIKPELRVTTDQTITLDARTATQYKAVTDPPVNPGTRVDILTFTRTSKAGGGISVDGFGWVGLFSILGLHLASMPELGYPKLYATPTAKVTKGFLGFDAESELAASEQDPSPQPRYLMTFPSADRIPGSLTYKVPHSAFTTVRSRAGQGTSTSCGASARLFPMVFLPWTLDELGWGSAIPLGPHTDYWYSSAPRITIWQTAYNASDCSRLWGPRRTIRPGEKISEDWGLGPRAPSPAAQILYTPSTGIGAGNVGTSDPLATVCGACRQDDNAMLDLTPFGDSDPRHQVATNDTGVSDLRFYRDGRLVLDSGSRPDGTIPMTGLELPLLHRAATYRLDWTSQMASTDVDSAETEWTFHSTPTGATSALPQSERCVPDPSRGCSFLPLLFPHYRLPLNDLSQAKANAPLRIFFSVEHQQYAPAPTGVSATVALSFDDGKTWTSPTAARPVSGGFAATINQPGPGPVSLRLQAHDAAGNSVQQTIIRAYLLAP